MCYQPCITKPRDDILSYCHWLTRWASEASVKSTCLCTRLVPASLCFLYTPTLQQQWRHPSQNLSLLRLVLLQVLFPAASILQAFFSRLELLRVRLLEFSVACACDLYCLCTFSSVPLLSLWSESKRKEAWLL